MKTPMFMVVAGEISGDLLGAALVRELKLRYPEATFWGVGGSQMKKEGLTSLFPMEELSLMGLVEVLPHIPNLLRRHRQLVDAAVERAPDVLVTIDAPDFSLRVAKSVKEQLGIPCLHYVSPSVWAWRQKRVFKMAGFLNHVLALFPFEPGIYAKADLSCTFVGHPLAERLAPYRPKKVDFAETQNQLALLPGSRTGEIVRLLPVMMAAFESLKQHNPELKAVVPLAQEAQRKLVKELIGKRSDVLLVKGEKRFAVLQDCRAALAASGTANLELAMLGVPMVVAYKMAPITYWLLKWLVKVPYISPVNWVAQHKVVPEFIQQEARAESLAAAVKPLLHEPAAWQAQAEKLKAVRKALTVQKSAAAVAAAVVASYLPSPRQVAAKNAQQSFDF